MLLKDGIEGYLYFCDAKEKKAIMSELKNPPKPLINKHMEVVLTPRCDYFIRKASGLLIILTIASILILNDLCI